MLRWTGPTLSEISRSHRERVTDDGGVSGVVADLEGLRGEPLFSLRLPWERLLSGKWNTTLRRRAFDGLVHLVITNHARRKPRAGGYVPLAFTAVTDLLGTRLGPEVLAAAQAMGIMECDQQGKAGRRYHGYRLSAAALSYGVRVMRAPAKYAAKLEARRELRPVVADSLIHREMLRTLRKVGFGASMWPVLQARQEASSRLSAVCVAYSVDAIRRGHWRMSVDLRTGRVFHNVANFPSELRPHLTLDGGETGEVDIASSQPYLLAYLAYRGDDSEEAQEFRALVTSERFYESFGEYAGLAAKERGKLKELFYTEVLFGLKRFRGKMWAAMALRFPRLAEYVDEVKREDYRALARLLQTEEARLVVGCIVPVLAAKGIEVLTIHDGILARREHLVEVQRVMVAELERATGIRPLVRIKGGPNSSLVADDAGLLSA